MEERMGRGNRYVKAGARNQQQVNRDQENKDNKDKNGRHDAHAKMISPIKRKVGRLII
jgi:hypothetical protein